MGERLPMIAFVDADALFGWLVSHRRQGGSPAGWKP